MSFFNTVPATQYNTVKRASDAYTAAGITPPASFATALKAHIRTIPDARQVAASIAAEAYRADADTDLAEFWADAVEQTVTALGADALRAQLTGALEQEERRLASQQIARAMEDVKPWADRQVKALIAAASKLPAGDAALDPEANLTAETGQHLTAARRALAALSLYASLPDTTGHSHSVYQLHRVLPLVDPGKPAVEVATAFGKTLNSDKLDNANAVRKLERDVRENIDLALVNVARGAYSGTTLAPAASPAQVGERAGAARNAFMKRAPQPSEESLYHMR